MTHVAVRFAVLLLIFASLVAQFAVMPGAAEVASSATAMPRVYLPHVILTSPPNSGQGGHRVNAPYIGIDSDYGYDQTAIFWFGRVTLVGNYADVRAFYDSEGVKIHLLVYDRYPWYDTSPAPGDFAAWDAISLYVSPRGHVGPTPGSSDYRFDAMFFPGTDESPVPPEYRVSFRGNGTGWAQTSAVFSTKSTYRGDGGPNGGRCQGWTLTYKVPYSSLGEQGPPSEGTVWGMAMVLHDRDDAIGNHIADQTWPPDVRPEQPASWGQFAFGIPTYARPTVTPRGTVTIRHELNNAVVLDAAVGGTFVEDPERYPNEYLCPGTHDEVWAQWGEMNFAGRTRVVIQNQGDVSEFSCFAKYYVTFPIAEIPAGKAIIKAELTLQQFGNSDPSGAKSSFIQVMTADRSWDEETLTWNNAPLSAGNVGGAWVDPIDSPWTPVNRVWDVSLPVAQAYAAGQPVRLILYDSDWDMHSGKYFESSQSTAGDGEGRPTLRVTWGEP